MLQSIVLGVIQGLTEFLPISSSGHLILIPYFFDWPDQGLAFDATVHIGTTLAIIVYYFQDIKQLISGLVKKEAEDIRYTKAIILGMIPAGLVGFLAKDFFSSTTRSVELVSLNLIIWGIVLLLADWYSRRSIKKPLSIKNGFVIGLAQILALFPGTSRSGITISAGLLQGVKSEDVVKFSFLMGVPLILGAGGLSIIDLVQDPTTTVSVIEVLVALISSFVSGIIAIHLLIKSLKSWGLSIFGIYRIVLGVLLLLI